MAVKSSESILSASLPARGASYPIPLVRHTSAGFIGRTERGPVNEPVAVRSFAEFYQIFGGHMAESFLSHAIQDYFLHDGATAVVVRLANRATRAEIDCPAGNETLTLAARCPGSSEKLRVSVDYEGCTGDDRRFNLVVQRLRRGQRAAISDQELYPQISVNPQDDRFVIDMLRNSRLVAVAGALPSVRPDPTPPERPGAPVRYIDLSRDGTDGLALTDYDLIGSKSQRTGIFAFDSGPRVDILCIPPPPDRDLGPTVLLAAERVCTARRSLFVLDPPWSWSSPDEAIAGARSFESSSRHLMTYYPRIRPRGERARFPQGLPACGAIAGLLSRQDSRGNWQDPDAIVLKASLTTTVQLSEAQESLLRRSGVNVFGRGRAGQVRLSGNLTLATPRQFGRSATYLTDARLIDFVLTSVEDAVEFVNRHGDSARSMPGVARRIRQFLTGLHERGVLAGDAPAESFFVRPAPDRAAPAAAIAFGFAVARPREFVAAEIGLGGEAPAVARLSSGLEAARLIY